MGHILYIEDESSQRETVLSMISSEGHQAYGAESVSSAIKILKSRDIDLILLDLYLPDMDGLDFIDYIKESDMNMPIIVVTSSESIKERRIALNKGAVDFILKPVDLDRLKISIQNAIDSNNREPNYLSKIIGDSMALINAKNDALKFSKTSLPVHIYGETGVGKEMFARAIHSLGNRKNKPFVTINCAAIPIELAESILFGHIKGSFSGAINNAKGKFLSADKGTIFLDEVSELPLRIQNKLLRVLQESEIESIGSNKSSPIDVMVISASNIPLEQAVRDGNFREDLYYRLNVLCLDIPPLRERVSDIPTLTYYFLNKFSENNKEIKKGISKESLEYLCNNEWTGNIRELKNTLHRSFIAAEGTKIEIEDITSLKGSIKTTEHNIYSPTDAISLKKNNKYLTLEEIIKEIIKKTLLECNYDVQDACQRLKVPKSTFYRKWRKLITPHKST